MKRFWMSLGGLLTIFVLFLAFNVVSTAWLRGGRADLTENKLYTLSEGTLNTLKNLKEPITLRFYFSKKLAQQAPALVTYAERVQELLEEYASKAKGQLKLEVADPVPFTEVEDQAVSYGLRGIPATAAGELLYFGLAGTNTTDGIETIPFFQEAREEFLEYDVTRLVYNLTNPEKKVVGILTALPLDGNPMARMMNPNASTQPWYAVEALRQEFDVRMIEATTEKLEKDLDVLLVVHPQGLSPQTLFEIDQFVLRGGRLLAFLDPFFEAQEVPQDPNNPLQAMMADRGSKLDPLLAAWGVAMAPEDLAADKDQSLRVTFQGGAVDYVLWLGLRSDKQALDENDITTSQIGNVNVAAAGILRKADGGTTTVTPLMQTTRTSMRIPKSRVQFGPDPKDLLATFQPGGEKLMLAARISGEARTAYPDGRPKKQEGDAEATPNPSEEVLTQSKGPIQVIVVADVDMLGDRMWVNEQNFFGQKIARPTADNGDFLVNAVDNLSGSSDLIGLRSRGRSIRPFDKVDELRRDAETRFRTREKELEAKLQDATQKINELQGNKDQATAMILSPEQEAEVKRFTEERDKTRKELRGVKADLQKDIEALKTRLVRWNGLAVPIMVALAGVGVWGLRRKKMVDARNQPPRGS